MTVQDLPSKVSTPEFEERSVPACIAVICAFAATGMLATNIFLPSLPSMAATLQVSSAAVTSAITVCLAIFAVGQLVVGPLSDRFGRRPVIASPLSSAAALSPFGNKAGVAAALLGFAQMAGGALGTLLAAAISSDPALGLGIVASLASPLALILCRLGGRLSAVGPTAGA